MDESDDGRITLRLEKDNLDAIDEFLETHHDYRNRSQLCRDAVQAFIENRNQGGNTVALQVPTRILEAIDHLVSDGYYNDREDAIVEALREHFTAEKLKESQATNLELRKAKGEVIELAKADGKDTVTK